MDCKPKSNGNVLLIDPNCVNINNDIVNGVSEYENKYIFAELTAESRGRTVVTIKGNTNSAKTDKSKIINFIGNNQDINNPNYLNFTTNYYEGSTGNATHYEGFGINSIKIKLNSSFIPQIDIQFIDVRGLAFFNQNDSPYRLLFDFPPPIFKLTVKGYYGKPIEYDIHLVKYTSEFSAANGNFIIDAQFVAMTFAPLSDILFRYVVNTPLIDDPLSANSKLNEPPANTFSLIRKFANLYGAIADEFKDDIINIRYNNINNDIKKIDVVLEMINPTLFSEDKNLKQADNTPYLIINEEQNYVEVNEPNSIPKDILTNISDVRIYNDKIKTEQSDSEIEYSPYRLFIGYVAGTDIQINDNNKTNDENLPLKKYFSFDTENDSIYDTPLQEFKKRLLSDIQSIVSVTINDDDISDPISFINKKDIRTQTISNTKYYVIDITKFYNKLYKNKTQLTKNKTKISNELTTKINNLVQERLGMVPTIYNIFKLILTDVDRFFKKLSSVSRDADNYHNNSYDKKIILGSDTYVDNKTHVYPFPLVIETKDERQQRVAPLVLQEKVEFPELKLVSDFIRTFQDQKEFSQQMTLRDNQKSDGTNKWIPISPFDSTLGGSTPESPYMGISDSVINDTLRILLKRFYMLSQGTLSKEFYPEDGWWIAKTRNIKRSEAYQKLYGYAEAANLVSALSVNNDAIDAIKTMVNKYSNNIELFYKDIDKISISDKETTDTLYDFPQYKPEYFLITPSITSEGKVYVDKYNPSFKGIYVIDDNINLKIFDENSNDPIETFVKELKDNLILPNAESLFDYTEENLTWIKDKVKKDGWKGAVNKISSWVNGTKKFDEIQGIKMFTRYLTLGEYYNDSGEGSIIYPGGKNMFYPGNISDNYSERQLTAYNDGNMSFSGKTIIFDGDALDSGKNIADIWSTQLGKYDTKIINDITGDKNLGSIIILSNFGYTASPFNIYLNSLNSIVFDNPAAIEVPSYYLPYLGGLITAIDEGWEKDIFKFFTLDNGKYLDNLGFYVLADLHDVKLYLSKNDKEILKEKYNTFRGSFNQMFLPQFNKLYNWIQKLNYDDEEDKIKAYYYALDSNAKNGLIENTNPGQFFNVIKDLITRTNFVNYSQITFKMSSSYPAGYTSLKDVNKYGLNGVTSGVTSQLNYKYFISFFERLDLLIFDKNKKEKERKEELSRIKGDTEIINQLYYSFKNINDKWLTGNDVTNYPYVPKGKNLIDIFAFVDRAMNPIGETIINCECLIDMLDDPNISLFTVLSQLLSLNGFEFFPLQNFLSFNDENSWEDSFKIHNGGYDDSQKTYFVCMYIGGSASYPSVTNNAFEEDGIINIADPKVKAFKSSPTGNNYDENISQKNNNNEFPWEQVRAFSVKFGEQNQSMFTDIKIDSKEYTDTNESIQILSRLAGDQGPAAPVPIGQNLYNLYENRSYKATVTGFGNVMIQPTQYFQIENIPLFNGAYIILNVEHNITANKMTTSFSGTKILKYPVPRVLKAVSVADYSDVSPQKALDLALTATMMSPERIQNNKEEGGLESELGIDLSHHNGNVKWNEIKKSGVKFGYLKLTEGNKINDFKYAYYNLEKNIKDAINNDIIISYYHFGRFGRTASPTQDGIDDATNFITNLNKVSSLAEKPKLPVVLDLEEECFSTYGQYEYSWGQISKPNKSINEFVESFIEEMNSNGYDVMIYCRTDLINKWDLHNYNKHPLWLARYMDLKNNNPEKDEPSVPKQWINGWQSWQFTPTGKMVGIRGDVDLNVMKKDFINKYIT
ncbi:MAG: glycoside hydrolase family 25 protein [Bacteroidales bacterium]|nr:glycoside hydrolase family 25 protein [Bacteroidales bacterium]